MEEEEEEEDDDNEIIIHHEDAFPYINAKRISLLRRLAGREVTLNFLGKLKSIQCKCVTDCCSIHVQLQYCGRAYMHTHAYMHTYAHTISRAHTHHQPRTTTHK